MSNTCVCCGEVIPEGVQVCTACTKTSVFNVLKDYSMPFSTIEEALNSIVKGADDEQAD